MECFTSSQNMLCLNEIRSKMGTFIQQEIATKHHFDGLHLTVVDGHIARLGKRGRDEGTGWGWMDAQGSDLKQITEGAAQEP